jgi:pimeloyl-ACP methyl ester carboxylesterase
MPFIHVAGERLFYALFQGDVTGRRNLVLVHGAAGNHIHWPAELRRLPDTNVYALDLPAHGRSGGGARSSLAEYADTVHLFALAVGLRQAAVLGHSMGGGIVQLLAARRLPWLERAVVIASGARLPVDPAILEDLRPSHAADGFARAVGLICERAYGPQASHQTVQHGRQLLLAVDRSVFYADYAACAEFDAHALLSAIERPVLIISGELDRMTPPDGSRYLADHISNAQLVELRGAGHMLIVEQPLSVAQAVSRFLSAG